MKTEMTTPREWFYNNEEKIRSMGFDLAVGDGGDIALDHTDIPSLIYITLEDLYDHPTYVIDMVEVSYEDDVDVTWDTEDEDDLFDILQEISDNKDLYSFEDEDL